MKTPTQIVVCWDNQDRNNEGWASVVTFADGHEESDAIDDDRPVAELVVQVGAEYGLQIDIADVATESDSLQSPARWVLPV